MPSVLPQLENLVVHEFKIKTSDQQFAKDFIDWIYKYPRQVKPDSCCLSILNGQERFKEGQEVCVEVPLAELPNEILLHAAFKDGTPMQHFKATFVRYRTPEERKEWRESDDCVVYIKYEPLEYQDNSPEVVKLREEIAKLNIGQDGIEKVYPSTYLSAIVISGD